MQAKRKEHCNEHDFFIRARSEGGKRESEYIDVERGLRPEMELANAPHFPA